MNTTLAIRRSGDADVTELRRVAERDCAEPPRGDALVAERDGAIVAWLEFASGRVGADPFVATADVVELLQLRARQLSQAAESSRNTRRWNSAISARSATAMLSSAPWTPSRYRRQPVANTGAKP